MDQIEILQARANILARFVHTVSTSLDLPELDHKRGGFRYAGPSVIHFCILRACRIVSALNAMLSLARTGFPQEIGILARIIRESSTQIDLISAQLQLSGTLSEEVQHFIVAYFEDDTRIERQSPHPQKRLSQKYINEQIDRYMKSEETDIERTTADRLRYIDWVFSNYVHGRYPEIMDMFGGQQPRFHLHGMRNTPKDRENVETLTVVIDASSLTLIGLCQSLAFERLIEHDEVLVRWRRRLGRFGAPPN